VGVQDCGPKFRYRLYVQSSDSVAMQAKAIHALVGGLQPDLQ
jgi:hypothetical protein